MKKKACSCDEPDEDDPKKGKGKSANFGGKKAPPFKAKPKAKSKSEKS